MIAALRGVLTLRNPIQIVVEVNGIGFELTVPLSTSRSLPEPGAEVRLLVQAVFTREGMFLYGFATAEEKRVFIRLTDIRGIGPKAALNLLSRFSPQEIETILGEQKIETLKTVPGIGPKRAALIMGRLQEAAPAARSTEPVLEHAIHALVSLGLTRAEAGKRLERIANRAELGLTELLARALRHEE
jgi:Holliday junction DNA helicase RuvA